MLPFGSLASVRDAIIVHDKANAGIAALTLIQIRLPIAQCVHAIDMRGGASWRRCRAQHVSDHGPSVAES
jgi:hypothetical protein